MPNRRISLLLDVCMLAAFAVLMSWRLTGVGAHEWIGTAFIALIVAHLLIHWGWVESRVGNAVRAGAVRRRLVPLLLNAALFVTMGGALVSGFVVSKVVMPNRLTPGDYLRWHGVHETASNLTVFILGLHVALNWDRILAGIRRASPGRGWNMLPATMVRRLAWITAVSIALLGFVWVGARLLPAEREVLMIFPDGHQERREPPPEIARLSPDADRPAPSRGAPKVLMSLLALSATAVVGRRVLKLRLGGPSARSAAPVASQS